EPWGLACLSDGTAWTLATPRILARISSDGTVAERVHLDNPWVEMFGAGDRLLYAQAPALAGSPVLTIGSPRRLQHGRPWAGLLARAAASQPNRGRRAGGRLHLGTVDGRELARVDLNPPARALLFATETSCILLTIGGELMEVQQP